MRMRDSCESYLLHYWHVLVSKEESHSDYGWLIVSHESYLQILVLIEDRLARLYRLSESLSKLCLELNLRIHSLLQALVNYLLLLVDLSVDSCKLTLIDNDVLDRLQVFQWRALL